MNKPNYSNGRILFLVNAFPSPDQPHKSPFNFRALKSLVAAGVDIQAVHLRSWAPGRKSIDRYELEGIPITAVSLPFYVKLPARLTALNLLVYKKLFNGLLPRLGDIRSIKLIHSVGAGHAGVVGSAISKKFKIPQIVQCIGSDINLVIPAMKNYVGVKGWEQHVKCFPCNSIELANQVKSLYPEAATEVIYRGVNLAEFFPNDQRRCREEFVFTYIGGFTPKETKPFGLDQKGGITVLKAWKQLKAANPAARVKLKFGGPAVKKETVAALYDGDWEKDGIEVIGQVLKTEVCPLFQSSDVVLIPSMFEGLPNAAMEAAAAGAALIGSRVGGIPEVINEGENGFIVDRKDEHALADRMLRLVNNQELAAQMGRAGRNFMEARFDNAQFARGYMNLYETILKG
ncbi:MAG TPA: glycosyltransferase family 4 protein [Flavitalea sp.]|nr:glycosyltransferase family 4 protein [Flavitalea sp.]